jgi:hypothetical protein
MALLLLSKIKSFIENLSKMSIGEYNVKKGIVMKYQIKLSNGEV